MHASLNRVGLGLIRMNPESNATHREAMARAWARGVRDFDLGFLNDPLLEGRADVLGEIVGTLSGEKPRAFVRGELGNVSSEALLRVREILPEFERFYLLSDPEFSLSSMSGNFRELDLAIRLDLGRLEGFAREGLLTAYGVGSAAFTYPKDDPEYLSLTNLVAPEATADRPGERLKHFRLIEAPLNLYESGAVLMENQSTTAGLGDRSLLTVAADLGLEFYARRPFDAMTEAKLIRLVAYPDHHRIDLDEAVMRTLDVAMKAESELLETSLGFSTPIHWAHRLRRQLTQVNDPEQWKQILSRKIEPELKAIYAEAKASIAKDPLVIRYQAAMEAVLLAVGMWFEKSAAERNERIRVKIVEAAPALRNDRSLAKTAMRIYRSIPGLNCVFVGMRSPRYVEEVLSTNELELSAADALRALEAAHTAIRDHLVEESRKGNA